SFMLIIRYKISPTITTGKVLRSVSLILGVTLHIRDKEVIQALASYFISLNGSESLTVKPYSIFFTNNSVSLYIRRFSDIINIIIPFFDKYPIIGVKFLNFAYFNKLHKLFKKKDH